MMITKQRPRERYMVASFTIEQAQHEWLQKEALSLTSKTQTRVSMSDIVRAVIAAMMAESHKASSNAHPDTE